MLFKNLQEANSILNEQIDDAAKKYLLARIGKNSSTRRMSRRNTLDNFVEFYFTCYPQIKNFTIDELNKIVNDESFKAFLASKGINEKQIVNEEKFIDELEKPYEGKFNITRVERDIEDSTYKPGEESHMVQLAKDYVNNPTPPVHNPSPLSVPTPVNVPTEDYKESPDMLTNTGYTQVMEPIKEEVINNTSTPQVEEPEKEVKAATPMVKETPVLNPNKYAKKYTKKNNESGVADVIVLSVIVVVYIAIIVNLVIRLK